MSLFEVVMLGLVEGIAEFLPISSTGHLILARELFGISSEYGLAFDAVLQLAAVLAVVVYFRQDLSLLARETLRALRGKGSMGEGSTVLLSALALGTVPAVFFGLLLERSMETVFRSAHLVAWVLIAGSVLFLFTEWFAKRYLRALPLTTGKGVVIGFFQALALVPGLSRSGAAISGGMLLGLSREASARFAFLLSIPIILGSGVKKMLELWSVGIPAELWHALLLASLITFVSGMVSIHYLLRFLRTHTLIPFAIYRVVLAGAVFYALK